jgi:hypothetical protein
MDSLTAQNITWEIRPISSAFDHSARVFARSATIPARSLILCKTGLKIRKMSTFNHLHGS